MAAFEVIFAGGYSLIADTLPLDMIAILLCRGLHHARQERDSPDGHLKG
jgi:hypothetical protein